jgi:hypothetical protein
MGRYYHGDIEGKFWFGVQDSRDPANFGGKETPIVDPGWEDLETGETYPGGEVIGSHFLFETKDLPDIQKGLDHALGILGQNKEKIDKFFEGRESYNDEMLCNHLELNDEANGIGEKEAMILTKAYLMLYARWELGMKIKECVEANGKCDFEADWN